MELIGPYCENVLNLRISPYHFPQQEEINRVHESNVNGAKNCEIHGPCVGSGPKAESIWSYSEDVLNLRKSFSLHPQQEETD